MRLLKGSNRNGGESSNRHGYVNRDRASPPSQSYLEADTENLKWECLYAMLHPGFVFFFCLIFLYFRSYII